MGLDSFVRHVTYVSGYSDAKTIEKIANAVNLPYSAKASDQSGMTVRVPFLYWRKDWAIHEWFIQHVYEGEDAETDVEFGVDKLQEFHDDLYTALTYPDTDDQLFDPNYWSDEEASPDRFANRRETLAIVAEELKRVADARADHKKSGGKNYFPTYEYHGSW